MSRGKSWVIGGAFVPSPILTVVHLPLVAERGEEICCGPWTLFAVTGTPVRLFTHYIMQHHNNTAPSHHPIVVWPEEINAPKPGENSGKSKNNTLEFQKQPRCGNKNSPPNNSDPERKQLICQM